MYMRNKIEGLQPSMGFLTAGLIALFIAAVFLLGLTPGYLLEITIDVATGAS